MGVNANIYTISPTFSGSEFSKEADYCDGAATGDDWCMELDWIEANGKCGGAATIHTIEGPGNDGCTAWGCRVSEHYGNSKFHMKIEYDALEHGQSPEMARSLTVGTLLLTTALGTT